MLDVLSITAQGELKKAFDEGMKGYGQGQFYQVYKTVYGSGAHGSEMPSDGKYERLGVKGGISTILEAPNPQEPEPLLSAPAPEVFTVEHERHAGAFKYNREIALDDKLGWYTYVAGTLGAATMFAKEVSMHMPFILSAGAGAIISGWDQLSLGNAAHRLLTGQTFDNTLTAAAPSETLLTNITAFFDRVPDHAGRATPVRNIFILTQLNNLRAWRQVLNAVAANVAITHPATGANQNPNMPSQFSADNFTVQGTPYIYGTNKHIAFGPRHGMVTYRRLSKDRMYTRDAPEELVHATIQKYYKGWSSANEILVIG